MKSKPLPSQERLKELLNYDPDTGVFTWKVKRHGVTSGSEAGCIEKYGYRYIKVDGAQYFAHRLAWMYVHGVDPAELQIDHVNQVKDDNKMSNLRLATHQQNQRNNKSKGICLHKKSNKWHANIRINVF